ncbi:MAG: methyl-accepting chemotaxis protein, partial [Bacillus sp. (in: firmicutes)]
LQQAEEVEKSLVHFSKNSEVVLEEISSLSSVSEQSSAAVEEVLASVEEQSNQITQVVESFKELEALTEQLATLVVRN